MALLYAPKRLSELPMVELLGVAEAGVEAILLVGVAAAEGVQDELIPAEVKDIKMPAV